MSNESDQPSAEAMEAACVSSDVARARAIDALIARRIAAVKEDLRRTNSLLSRASEHVPKDSALGKIIKLHFSVSAGLPPDVETK